MRVGVQLDSSMIAPVPNLLGEDYLLRKREIWDSNVCVEINPVLQVCQESQLATIETPFRSRIEKVHVVWFSLGCLCEAISGDALADTTDIRGWEVDVLQRIGNTNKMVPDTSLCQHDFEIPCVLQKLELRDSSLGRSFDASSVRPYIDDDVINFSRDELSQQSPKLPNQVAIITISCAYQIASLNGEAVQ